MEGDVFEMEDQRNWSDGSYKTYCRPLDLPYPYPLKAGQEIRQSITIEVIGQVSAVRAPPRPAGTGPESHGGGEWVPQIGLGGRRGTVAAVTCQHLRPSRA